MIRDQETNIPLRQRVDDYLSKYSTRPNSFIIAAEVATAEADMSEYLLRRAEKELQEAQSRVDEIQQKIVELSSAH